MSDLINTNRLRVSAEQAMTSPTESGTPQSDALRTEFGGDCCGEAHKALLLAEKLERQLAEKQAEVEAARETNKRFHHRVQVAEAAIPDYRKLVAVPPDGDGLRFVSGGLGRALLHYECHRADERITELEAALTAERQRAERAEARLDLLGGYLDMGDADSIRSAIMAWQDDSRAARQEEGWWQS